MSPSCSATAAVFWSRSRSRSQSQSQSQSLPPIDKPQSKPQESPSSVTVAPKRQQFNVFVVDPSNSETATACAIDTALPMASLLEEVQRLLSLEQLPQGLFLVRGAEHLNITTPADLCEDDVLHLRR
mmetsp:Transcript_455/g.629  ORF Transcript_455/g.629 Transcript_455/m.629 type:complete len:127 (-) Transcript_455:371-751(-)